MKANFSASALLMVVCVFAGCATNARRERASQHSLPPVPEGVTELKFSEFFVAPVGARGLEFTDKLTGLDGKRVRILGYMVRQEHGVPGKFLFAAIPVQLHDHDTAFADDLPPAVVSVIVPGSREATLPYVEGLMLLTGTLSVGHCEEADGRNSIVRLTLDNGRGNEQRASLLRRTRSL